MTCSDANPPPLLDELRAVLASLQRVRQRLAAGDVPDVETLRTRMEACAQRVDGLDRQMCKTVEPPMLALLDELERTITAFEAERRDLGAKLRSTSRSLAADSAYRRAGGR